MAHFFVVAEAHIKKAPLCEQWSLEGSFAVLLDGFVPWQDVVEVFGMPLDVGVWQVLEKVLEILERVQAVGLGSLDDAVGSGAGFCSFRGVAEQPVLAADEVFFLQVWRDGLDEVPPCMCPAEGMTSCSRKRSCKRWTSGISQSSASRMTQLANVVRESGMPISFHSRSCR